MGKGSKGLRRQDEMRRKMEQAKEAKAREKAEKQLRAALPPPLLPFAAVADPARLHKSIVAARTAGGAEATVASPRARPRSRRGARSCC